jgi:hypothetical protein
MVDFLTKSNFMSGLQCHKQLWLEVKQPHRSTPLTPAQHHIMAQGEKVGQYARQQFPKGQLIKERAIDAIEATETAIASGATCLFEAAFSFNGLLVRCDILQQVSADTWELIEVKSSTEVKEEHHWDVAVQTYVLTGVGLTIHAAKLMYINTQTCFFPDLTSLFTIANITIEVDRLLPEIPKKLHQFKTLLSEDLPTEEIEEPSAPTVAIGKHCHHPNSCPFRSDCWQHVPEVSIFTIPRLAWQKKDELIAQGILTIADLPVNYSLSDHQRTYVDSVCSNQAVIDWEAIAAELSKLEYPIHFFDFETQSPAIPRFDGLRPYEQFPFQYSCHILHSDRSVEHREYLHIDQSNPKPALVAALIRDIAASGSVVVYHQSFEASILRKLAASFPEYALQLGAIGDRLWDLENIFKYHYKHPDFRGSTSIKNILPVLVPTLSYKTLTIQRGDQAQTVWETMISCTDPHKKQGLINDLYEYCKLDTLAMVEIHQSLIAQMK